MIWFKPLCSQYQMEEKEGKSMAICREAKDKPWLVLDDYTLNVIAEFEKISEAENYARSQGQSVAFITWAERQEIVG